MGNKIGIAGFGYYLPEKKVSVKELCRKAGIPEIVAGYIGAETVGEADIDELPSDMAIKAAEAAVKDANINPSEIDLIINCPAGMQDYILPSVVGKVQHAIGANNSVCFEVQQGCCGMLTGLEIAYAYILSGRYNTVLLLSSDKWSAYTDHHSAEAVVFGDGAGAVIVRKNTESFFIKDFIFKTAGKFYNLYGINSGGVKNISLNEDSLKYKCLNPEIARKEFKNIYISSFGEISRKILNKNRLKDTDIKYLSMVNANLKLLDVVASELNISLDKTCREYLITYGHVGGFDIFFNMLKASEANKLNKGDLTLLLNAGIGFTWGAALIEY